jgi:hypothetical protein
MHGRIPLAWHFGKIGPALLASLTFGVHTDSVTMSWVIMACTDQKTSKQVTVGIRKHRTLTVPQKLEIIRTEYGKIQTEVIASYI